MPAALEITNLKKSFFTPLVRKKIKAVEDLSFTINEGGLVGFLGANGAGKTTTLKVVMGLIFADSGQVRILGRDHRDLESKQSIGFLTERPYFYDYLTGREFLTFCARLFRDPEAPKRVDPLLEEVGLTHAADRQLRRYSKGMLQRVGIAQALINNPKLLILDEPMSGLDPDGRAEVVRIIERAHQRGTTVLFSTHLLPDVETLCDRVIIIDKGQLVIESPVVELLESYSEGFLLELLSKSSDFKTIKRNTIKTDEELQRGIAEAIRSGDKIVRVSKARPSLEEVFLRLKKERA